MKKSILKPILAGVVFGTFAFFLGPFVLLLGLVFLVFARRRFSHRMAPIFADKVRNMSDEEYAAFKSRFEKKRC